MSRGLLKQTVRVALIFVITGSRFLQPQPRFCNCYEERHRTVCARCKKGPSLFAKWEASSSDSLPFTGKVLELITPGGKERSSGIRWVGLIPTTQ
ncbi:hypothetical protein B0F90DRAFT_1196806 [Multifurca ochricompacta]|uniref:Uncharacterized protein n=1 Tax=Multifurca ochricompacta TaxID=376703 RepID=A0AAD4M867_9AGAM|nr:hypothetical protein B0F90DRAFT_1196806 [Multifurca ochricompacta]